MRSPSPGSGMGMQATSRTAGWESACSHADFLVAGFADSFGARFGFHFLADGFHQGFLGDFSECGNGHFIEDFRKPIEVPKTEAANEARCLSDEAREWCFDNGIEHDIEGWNQTADYFARCVAACINGKPSPTRIVE